MLGRWDESPEREGIWRQSQARRGEARRLMCLALGRYRGWVLLTPAATGPRAGPQSANEMEIQAFWALSWCGAKRTWHEASNNQGLASSPVGTNLGRYLFSLSSSILQHQRGKCRGALSPPGHESHEPSLHRDKHLTYITMISSSIFSPLQSGI